MPLHAAPHTKVVVLHPAWKWRAHHNEGSGGLRNSLCRGSPRDPADKNCPVHRRPCVNRKEENYFFALSKYQAQLEELCSNPGGFSGWLGAAAAGVR